MSRLKWELTCEPLERERENGRRDTIGRAVVISPTGEAIGGRFERSVDVLAPYLYLESS